jgi:hypothetical protein
MYGMHVGGPMSAQPVERSAARIAMRSRRSARAEERAHWIARDEHQRAGPVRRLRLVHSAPAVAAERGLALVRRA